jgi:hypothetical protein
MKDLNLIWRKGMRIIWSRVTSHCRPERHLQRSWQSDGQRDMMHDTESRVPIWFESRSCGSASSDTRSSLPVRALHYQPSHSRVDDIRAAQCSTNTPHCTSHINHLACSYPRLQLGRRLQLFNNMRAQPDVVFPRVTAPRSTRPSIDYNTRLGCRAARRRC